MRAVDKRDEVAVISARLGPISPPSLSVSLNLVDFAYLVHKIVGAGSATTYDDCTARRFDSRLE